ncbi:hypothetical protein B0H14DRAFT_2652146 [Mycena olivaceomarginata]|nr:hypothetical protein B0H14DRAFT_2652146 [Mycena olivaceomarginata]
MASLDGIDVNPDWVTLLSPLSVTIDLHNPRIQCHLLFTLLIFFGLSVRGQAASWHPHGQQPDEWLGPERIFKAWHDRFPKSIPHLHSTIIKPCMEEIALKESDRVINYSRLKVRLVDCTLDYIRNVLNPGVLPGIYLEDAPYTWDYLSVFTTSPNKWRKERARTGKNGKPATPKEVNEWEETSSGGTEN